MQNYIITHNVAAPFTANGSTDHIQVSITVAPLLWPGALAMVSSNTQTTVEVLILEDLGNGAFRVRKNDTSSGNPNYGGPMALGPVAVPTPAGSSDLSAYLVADAAQIFQYANQFIFPYAHDGVIPRTPSALQGQ